MDEVMYGYVTLSEADTYIEEHYLSTDESRLAWEGLDDEDKCVLLRQAFQLIEMQPFTGRKLDGSQPNAFPRWPNKDVPNNIKYAQVEQALSGSDPVYVEESKKYQQMQMRGVSSYTIGNLSESFNDRPYSNTSVLSTVTAYLLSPYLKGSYPIR